VGYGTWGLLLAFDGLKSSLGQGRDFARWLLPDVPRYAAGLVLLPQMHTEFVIKLRISRR